MALGFCSSLRILYVNDNKLIGTGIRDEYSKMASLRYYDMSVNAIDERSTAHRIKFLREEDPAFRHTEFVTFPQVRSRVVLAVPLPRTPHPSPTGGPVAGEVRRDGRDDVLREFADRRAVRRPAGRESCAAGRQAADQVALRVPTL